MTLWDAILGVLSVIVGVATAPIIVVTLGCVIVGVSGLGAYGVAMIVGLSMAVWGYSSASPFHWVF